MKRTAKYCPILPSPLIIAASSLRPLTLSPVLSSLSRSEHSLGLQRRRGLLSFSLFQWSDKKKKEKTMPLRQCLVGRTLVQSTVWLLLLALALLPATSRASIAWETQSDYIPSPGVPEFTLDTTLRQHSCLHLYPLTRSPHHVLKVCMRLPLFCPTSTLPTHPFMQRFFIPSLDFGTRLAWLVVDLLLLFFFFFFLIPARFPFARDIKINVETLFCSNTSSFPFRPIIG